MTQNSQSGAQDTSVHFHNITKDLTHQWGFVVVVTATAPSVQREAALENLRTILLSSQNSNAEFDPSTLALPAMQLEGADYAVARAAFSSWISTYDDEEDKWESDVRRDVFIVVDEPALASLLADDRHAWVVVIDVESSTRPRSPDYGGWMRCRAGALPQLSDDLQGADEAMASLCPARSHSAQIPLYNGSPEGALLEPEGGVGANPIVEFPRGTQRGVAVGTQRGTVRGTIGINQSRA